MWSLNSQQVKRPRQHWTAGWKRRTAALLPHSLITFPAPSLQLRWVFIIPCCGNDGRHIAEHPHTFTLNWTIKHEHLIINNSQQTSEGLPLLFYTRCVWSGLQRGGWALRGFIWKAPRSPVDNKSDRTIMFLSLVEIGCCEFSCKCVWCPQSTAVKTGTSITRRKWIKPFASLQDNTQNTRMWFYGLCTRHCKYSMCDCDSRTLGPTSTTYQAITEFVTFHQFSVITNVKSSFRWLCFSHDEETLHKFVSGSLEGRKD